MSSSREILRLWQEHHGPLTQDEQSRFLAKCERPEICALMDIPYLALTSALKSRKKLEEVLDEARRIMEDRKNHESRLPKNQQPPPAAARREPTPNEVKGRTSTSKSAETRPAQRAKQNQKGRYRKYGPTGKPSQSDGLRNAISTGIPGGLASYSSGLVHNPSASEFSTGDRCEHCGAHIPNGGAHDKCNG